MGTGMWIFVIVVGVLLVAGLVVLARRPSGGATTSEHDYSNPHIGEGGRPHDSGGAW